MKNINIGIANLVVSKLIEESYTNDSFLNEAKNVASKLFDVVKNSPILQLEFKVFKNIENKHIDDDVLISRYIDNNIKLFEIYTLEELNNEHMKLKPFIGDNVIENEKTKLYNAIDCLIEESLKCNEDINVDNIHESFTIVLDYIKKPKQIEKEIEIPENINEEVIEIAIDKFNEKYEKMTIAEAKLLKKLITATDNEKQKLFELYKKDDIKILNSLLTENSNNEKITKSIDKIEKMTYNSEQVDSDIIKLFELKQGLL